MRRGPRNNKQISDRLSRRSTELHQYFIMNSFVSVVSIFIICFVLVKANTVNNVEGKNVVSMEDAKSSADHQDVDTLDLVEENVSRSGRRTCPCTCFHKKRTALRQCRKYPWKYNCSVISCTIWAGHYHLSGYTCCY